MNVSKNINSAQTKQTSCRNEAQKKVIGSLMYPLGLEGLTVPPVVLLICKNSQLSSVIILVLKDSQVTPVVFLICKNS